MYLLLSKLRFIHVFSDYGNFNENETFQTVNINFIQYEQQQVGK